MPNGSPRNLTFQNASLPPNLSGSATQSNTANVLTIVSHWAVPRTDDYVLYDQTPLQLELKTSAPAQLPGNTRLILGILPPLYDQPIQIWSETYEAWAETSYANQLSGLFQQNFLMEIPHGGTTFRAGSVITFSVLSSSVLSIANSKLRMKIYRLPAQA